MQISNDFSCPLSYPLSVPYTGTKEQPDIVSLFFKNDKNEIFIDKEDLHASSNYYPLNFVEAINRIKEAASKIFLCMKGEEEDLWNATKNLTRGVVALIPIIGNATLYLYDRIKENFYVNPEIKKALLSQNGPVLGVAFDGKVIKTFSQSEFSSALKGQPHDPLGVLSYIWFSLLQKSLNQSTMTREKLVNQLF